MFLLHQLISFTCAHGCTEKRIESAVSTHVRFGVIVEMVLSHPSRIIEHESTKRAKRTIKQNAVMKGRCVLDTQPDTRGISKKVVYAIGMPFVPAQPKRRWSCLYSCQKGVSISQSSSSTELLPLHVLLQESYAVFRTGNSCPQHQSLFVVECAVSTPC